jgi:hypothetical protein
VHAKAGKRREKEGKRLEKVVPSLTRQREKVIKKK